MNELNQFRKVGCSDWYDGFPDHEDGKGPYEVRTLYLKPVQQPAPVADALMYLCNWLIEQAHDALAAAKKG